MSDCGNAIMDSGIHDIIHLISEIQKEEAIQMKSAIRKKELLNRLGTILDREVLDGKPDQR